MMPSATTTGSMTMAIKLSMTDTAVVLWALRSAYGDGKAQGVEKDDPVLGDLERLIKTYDRSFKALLRVEEAD